MKELRLLKQNIVLISGYLGKDPDFKSTSGGTTICSFSLGVSRSYKDKSTGEWKDDTTWVPVDVWGEAADRLRDKLKKGSPVHVEGRLKARKWEDKKTGQMRTALDVVANRVQFLARLSSEGESTESSGSDDGQNANLEEVPF